MVDEALSGDGGRDPGRDEPRHLDLALPVPAARRDAVSDADGGRRFRPGAIDADVPGSAGIVGRRTGFEDAHGPQPAVDAYGIHGSIVP